MANREKGEVSITIDGRVYRMALTLDAMVALEEMFSTPEPVTFQWVVDRSDAGSMKHTRALIWAVLQCNDPPPDIKDVSKLVEKAGGMAAFTSALMEMAKSIAPDPRDLNALGIKENPPAAQAGRRKAAGTGVGSTSTPGAQA